MKDNPEVSQKLLQHLYTMITIAIYLVEKELKLFISQVDTRLLKAVVLKMFETKNVQNSCK